MSPTERIAMLTSTMNDVAASTSTSVLGEVLGLTVGSCNVGSRLCTRGTAVVEEPIG
jgi:hypothetical protein